jgi:putative phosphoesterase
VRLAILSDVHANLPALEAVLDVLRRESPDAYVCAGDLVGYGAFPNECIEVLSELENLVSVAGNHDLIAVGKLSSETSIRMARETLAWTATELRQPSRAFLESLPLRATAFEVAVAHGSLTDPREYVRERRQIVAQLMRLEAEEPEARLLVLGHTHRAGGWARSGAKLRATGDGVIELGRARPALLNPGSVGQSRELAVHARCMLLDTVTMSARSYAVPYDTERCRQALSRAGLPRDTYHLPFWRTTRRLAPVRRLVRRIAGGRR